MRKNVINWMLLAAFVCGLSLFVTSCKDDDDEKSEQRRSDADPLDTDEAQVAWRWLSVMTDVEKLDNNWSSKTYEPTVGVASEQNRLTRLVVVKDMDEAREHFASIADLEVSQLTQEQTVSQKGVGKLTWTPSKAGAQNLAEVVVDTKLIPNLQKLIYCTSEQTGLNGLIWDNVKGTAYYRFGDVVADAQGYYWVCVRPSFQQGDKGDSHWINIFNAGDAGMYEGTLKPMPQDNVKDTWNDLEKYGWKTILLPTNLKYERKHIYNLSNLIWALLKTDSYVAAAKSNSNKGLGGFDLNYHGKNFLQRVAAFWDKPVDGYTMWEKLFHRKREKMETLTTIKFFYKGYSWKWGNDATLWMYQSQRYEPSIPGSESGDKKEFHVVQEGFDITYFAASRVGRKLPDNLDTDAIGTWVVRYKTGDQLCSGGSYSPYLIIPGCSDIYRYNAETGANPKSELETEDKIKFDIPLNKVKVGDLIGQDGLYYETVDATKSANTTPVAVVCYVGVDKRAVENGTKYHGLAIACKDVSTEYAWADKDLTVTCTDNPAGSAMQMGTYDGIANTQKLLKCQGHTHPIVTCLKDCPTFKDSEAKTRSGISDWFVPSLTQWSLFFSGIGLYSSPQGDKICFVPMGYEKTIQSAIEGLFANGKGDPLGGLKQNTVSESYWLSTEKDSREAWNILLQPDGKVTLDDGKVFENEAEVRTVAYLKKGEKCVRPFLAFGFSGQ